jgi:hypothetical protein
VVDVRDDGEIADLSGVHELRAILILTGGKRRRALPTASPACAIVVSFGTIFPAALATESPPHVLSSGEVER